MNADRRGRDSTSQELKRLKDELRQVQERLISEENLRRQAEAALLISQSDQPAETAGPFDAGILFESASLVTYKGLVESSPEAITVIAPDHRIMLANQQAATLFGYSSPEKLIGMDSHLLIHPADLPAALEAAQKAAGENPLQSYECRHQRPDDSHFQAEVSLAPIRSADGKLAAMMAVTREITARKQVEAMLHHREEEDRQRLEGMVEARTTDLLLIQKELKVANEALTATLEALPELVFEVDSQGTIVAFHASDSNYLKLTPTTALGKNAFDFLPPEWVEPAQKTLQEAVINGQHRGGVYPLQFDDRSMWFEISFVAKGTHLPAEWVVVIARDITTRMQAELASQHLNRELQAINACRQALIRATDELSLFREICAIVCEIVGFRMAWVGLAEQDPLKKLRPVAWAGTNSDFLLNASLTWADNELGQGPAAKAVRTGKTSFVHDFKKSQFERRNDYIDKGFLSAMALPLIIPDRVVLGSITIYADHPHAFAPEEVQLLEGLANDIAYGVASLRARAERDRVQDELESSTKMVATIFELSPDAIVLTTGKVQCIVDCNQAFLDLLGFNMDEVIGRTADELAIWTPVDRQDYLGRADPSGDVRNLELTLQRKDGSSIVVLNSSRKVSIGENSFVMSFTRDITELKHVEQINQARLNLIQFAIGHSLDELLEETLNEVEKLTGSLIGFYHFLEDDQRTVSLQTGSTRTKVEFCAVDNKNRHYDLDDAGVWADAIRERQVVIHNDYAALPNRKGLPEGHAEIKRELVCPVLRGDKVMAVLGVGNKPVDYTPKDVETIFLIATLAWEIVQRTQAENALQANMAQIERFNRLAVGREGRMVELKNEVNGLAQALSWPLPYPAIGASVNEPPPDVEVLKTSIDLSLEEILDLSQVDQLLEPLGAFMGCAVSLLDLQGNVLLSAHSQSVCEGFHLKSELTRENCRISDLSLISQLRTGKEYAISRCLNGMTDAASPIILENRTMAYLFIGEFFTQPPDLEAFRQRALAIGFDEPDYLKAVQQARIHEEDSIPGILRLLTSLVRQMAGFAYDRWLAQKTEELVKQRADELHRQQLAAVSLAEDAELARQEIALYRNHLEELVQERTSQLSETAARLESANQELEAFTYSVSHDLRAPLRSVDGFSQILLEEYTSQIDSEGQNYLKRIRGGAERMSLLIEDLLHLSRISRAEIHPTRVDLSQMVRDINAELAEAQPDRNVITVVAPDLVTLADQGLAHVILENLLSNAWKFTSHHDEARIEFSAIPQDGQVVYFVKDDGAGFNPDYAYKLFSVFQRLHNEKDFPGTGVGLATVKRVITRHGGRIWAEGEVESGATFFFTLPAAG